MKIYLGADHRGYKLKEALKKELKIKGYEVMDMGAEVYDEEDDYVDYAIKVCEKISGEDRGVLLCGSGHGVEMVANRFGNIRSVLGFNLDVVVQGREDENANVLSLPAEWITEEEAVDMVEVFMSTNFSEAERHIRRLNKIEKISK
jgi:ribose 5-phosphate isomerase B